MAHKFAISRGRLPVIAGCGLAFAILAATLGDAVADFKPENCQRENMPAETLRTCATMIAKPDMTARERSAVHAAHAAQWMKEDEPAAAVLDYARAIEADPTNFAALIGRARAYALTGTHDRAVEDWSRVIALQPDRSESYDQRGRSWLSSGRTDEALADFSRAIEINAHYADAFIGRAWVYDKLNDRAKAVKEFELAVAAAPTLWTTYLARAEIAERWGDKQMAIDNYKLVIKYNNRYWNAYKILHRMGVERYLGQDDK